jgi:hypothetical protein
MNVVKCLSVSLLTLAAGSVSAGEFYQNGPTALLTQNGIEQGLGTNVNFPPAASQNYPGTAGQFSGYFGTIPDGFLRFFCMEFQSAGANTTYVLNAVAPVGLSAATYQNLQRLYDLHYPKNGQVDFYNGAQTAFGLFSSATDAAAFQLAVWEIVFDSASGLNLASGNFTGNGNVYSPLAASWLSGLGASTGYQNWTVYTLTNASQQDFVTATFHAPEPGSLALVALALAGVGFIRRRS